MKLKSIGVQGLYGEYDYTLNLKETELTYIHSMNGYGKSTLMKLVSDVLNGNVEGIDDCPFTKLVLEFDDDMSLFVEKRKGLKLQIKKNKLVETVDPEDLGKIMGITYIPPERRMVRDGDRILDSIDLLADDVKDTISKAGRNNVLDVAPRDPKEFSDQEVESVLKSIKSKLEFLAHAGFVPSFPSRLRMNPSRYDISNNKSEYVGLIHALRDYIEEYSTLAESITVFLDVVNGIWFNKDLCLGPNGLSVSMSNGTVIPLSKLSSGEKQILCLFYPILFDTAPGSLVVIDEPEVSLHISWQQRLGSIFREIGKLRDLQIIVATHSPQVIHDDWDCAIELRKRC